ncbi:MAG: hypothetical protein IPN85_07700 [Flavobacteriales bacterium]|nr:hypothetical protein [Flavobacteriales bacterium]MBL0037052.1 hypothetical protein [Flavobacteriales bacterium]
MVWLLILLIPGLLLCYVVCLAATIRQRFRRPRWNNWLIALNVVLLVAMVLFIPLWIYMNIGGYREPGSRERDPFTEVWFYSPVAVIAFLIATLVYASIRSDRARKARAVSP